MVYDKSKSAKILKAIRDILYEKRDLERLCELTADHIKRLRRTQPAPEWEPVWRQLQFSNFGFDSIGDMHAVKTPGWQVLVSILKDDLDAEELDRFWDSFREM